MIMTNLVVVPIVVPLLAGMVTVFLRRFPRAQRGVGLAGVLIALGAAAMLVRLNATEGIQVLHIGGWPAPYGISLVADMLSSLLVLTAVTVAFACLLYAFDRFQGTAYESHYVYPLMLLLVCGVNGSFLTGDIFNLFVFFEVTLIASYVLLSLGGGRNQLRQSIKYVLINMIASTLFVVAIAYLYAVTGTLNIAHLSERVALAGQGGLLTTVGLLFLIVFAVKAGLVLFFWLPGPYSAPPPAVSAMFAALLTKVGVYAILRMFTLVFYHDAQVTHTVLTVFGAIGMILGALGAVAHWGIRKILAYNVIVSVGFMAFGIGLAGTTALAGTVYYLIHDMIAKAWVFILGGAIIAVAGTDRLREIKGLIRFRPLLGWLFLLATLALAGVPPLSGFVGKLMILSAGIDRGQYAVAAVGLITSLLVLYSLLKVFIHSFWGEMLLNEGEERDSGIGALLPGTLLAAIAVGLGIWADGVLALVDTAVETLHNPRIYINAVLGR
jgi:multicomponent Na+:H+ antiporter subunit D